MRFLSNYLNNQRIAMRRWTAILLILVLVTTSIMTNHIATQASGYSLVVLSSYNRTLKIGQSFFLVGVASNGKRVTWKSSKAGIASVNVYGQVTAKKAGTCKITGKVSGGEASCKVTVEKTRITLSAATLTLENGDSAILKGFTSNGSSITWKSQKTSVATIDDNGRITAVKPGESNITAKADGSTSVCKLIVKKPQITLSKTSVSLYRGQNVSLTAKTSSGRKVTWQSKKKSVAIVNAGGKVTAIKHGTARITVALDGVTKECEVIVKSPTIKLSKTSATLRRGKSLTVMATVSSGNKPIWKSSKSSVASVDSNGRVTAKKKGSCYIYATEDGTKESCHIQVTA